MTFSRVSDLAGIRIATRCSTASHLKALGGRTRSTKLSTAHPAIARIVSDGATRSCTASSLSHRAAALERALGDVYNQRDAHLATISHHGRPYLTCSRSITNRPPVACAQRYACVQDSEACTAAYQRGCCGRPPTQPRVSVSSKSSTPRRSSTTTTSPSRSRGKLSADSPPAASARSLARPLI